MGSSNFVGMLDSQLLLWGALAFVALLIVKPKEALVVGVWLAVAITGIGGFIAAGLFLFKSMAGSAAIVGMEGRAINAISLALTILILIAFAKWLMERIDQVSAAIAKD